MTRAEFDACWHAPQQLRAVVDRVMEEPPELFPPYLRDGYAFHGLGRPSAKLDGMRLRKVRPAGGGPAYHLRPSFVLRVMTGTTDDLAYPLRLASFGVPTVGFGHSDLYWHRVVERVGPNSLVGHPVRDPDRVPEPVAADEHHVDWNGATGYVATTAAGGRLLGIGRTAQADEAHLTAAYGGFPAEAREVDPEYAPRTVNMDGWATTQNAFRAGFAGVAVILCFRHGFLKIRDRGRKHRALRDRVWDVYRAATAAEFRDRMATFWAWFEPQAWSKPVREMVEKLWNRGDEYAAAYDHPGCHRTSHAVDRPRNRLRRLAYTGRGMHGHQASSERRPRGWALLLNFRPFAGRSGLDRGHQSRAHRLNGKKYSDNPYIPR